MKEAWYSRLCATIIGIVFFVSGSTKIIDPVGTSLIVEEYFKLFHVGFLSFSAPLLGILIGIIEMTISAAMLCKVYRLTYSFITGGIIVLFTLVTLVLVIVNPDMNCGCFGEVLEIDHFESFIKNIGLLLLAAGAFTKVFIDYYKGDKKQVRADSKASESSQDVDEKLRSNRLYKYRNRKYRLTVFYFAIAASLAFAIYNRVHLPLIDFTAMAPGAELSSSAQAPELSFIYEKDGLRKTFALEQVPDSTWTYVGPAEEVDSQLNETHISIYDPWKGEYADEILLEGDVIVFSFYKKASKRQIEAVRKMIVDAQKTGFKTVVISSTDQNLTDPLGVFKVYKADRKTIMTLNRNSSGATAISDGTIVRKWAKIDFPSQEELREFSSLETEEQVLDYVTGRQIWSQIIGILVLTILVIY